MRLLAVDLREWIERDEWRGSMHELSNARRERVLACRTVQGAARQAAAGWLLSHALLRAGVALENQVFAANEWGKPVLADSIVPQFSLSHCENWVVCATGTRELGVDVEEERPVARRSARYLHVLEQDYLDCFDCEDWTKRFWRIWVAKEAFVKAIGRGTSIPLDGFSVRLADDGAKLCQSISPNTYKLIEYILPAAHVCLCCDERDLGDTANGGDGFPKLEIVNPFSSAVGDGWDIVS